MRLSMDLSPLTSVCPTQHLFQNVTPSSQVKPYWWDPCPFQNQVDVVPAADAVLVAAAVVDTDLPDYFFARPLPRFRSYHLIIAQQLDAKGTINNAGIRWN